MSSSATRPAQRLIMAVGWAAAREKDPDRCEAIFLDLVGEVPTVEVAEAILEGLASPWLAQYDRAPSGCASLMKKEK